MTHRSLVAAALVLASAVGLAASQDQKGKTQTALGVVSTITANSVSVDTSKGILQFVTTDATRIQVVGGGSKTQAAKDAGQKGVKITDVLHMGDQVTVKYTEADGKMMASQIEVRVRRPQAAQPVK